MIPVVDDLSGNIVIKYAFKAMHVIYKVQL